MINTNIKFTVDDYLCTPDDQRYELVEGELLLTPSPTPEHQDAVGEVFVPLKHFVRAHDLGHVWVAPLDTVLSEHNVYQPDVLFVSKERLDVVRDRVWGAPDLAVEVLSPSTERRDRVLKLRNYARYGVKEVWFVDLRRREIEVLCLGPEGYGPAGVYGPGDTVRSPLLPGFELLVDSVIGS